MGSLTWHFVMREPYKRTKLLLFLLLNRPCSCVLLVIYFSHGCVTLHRMTLLNLFLYSALSILRYACVLPFLFVQSEIARLQGRWMFRLIGKEQASFQKDFT